jgi:protein-S-isoprenylcysteine O-methyltransferase Ste14
LTEPKSCDINGGVPPGRIDIMSDKGLVTKVLIRFISGLVLIGVFFFGTAGTLKWPEAWIFIGIQFSWSTIHALWLMKHNPELLKDRLSIVKKSTKRWDKLIQIVSTPFFLAFLAIPGLDAVRFRWSRVPTAVEAICFVLAAAALFWNSWVMRENTYLSRVVAIQTERGHQVITTGPYRYIRHPLYAATILLFFCLPLALGSLYTLIPGAFLTVSVVVRAYLEDRTLHKELEGYVDYARRTKYRLIPGIW